jgi:DNA-binding response OmpR family regulator
MGGEAHTVLVVDDDESLRMLCRVNLEIEGYRVLEAPTVDTAHRLLRDEPVDVVLLDVHVGEEDGLGLLSQLTRDGVRAVILSGTMPRGFDYGLGEDAVLVKPFTPEALVAAVEGAGE